MLSPVQDLVALAAGLFSSHTCAHTYTSLPVAKGTTKYLLFLSLQQTLPPIKNHPMPNLPAGHFQRRLLLDKEASRVWVRPEPPKPMFLHLGVTARSYSVEDFFSNFTSEFPKYFLSR